MPLRPPRVRFQAWRHHGSFGETAAGAAACGGRRLESAKSGSAPTAASRRLKRSAALAVSVKGRWRSLAKSALTACFKGSSCGCSKRAKRASSPSSTATAAGTLSAITNCCPARLSAASASSTTQSLRVFSSSCRARLLAAASACWVCISLCSCLIRASLSCSLRPASANRAAFCDSPKAAWLIF